MCEPVHTVAIPTGLDDCCDAVASLYLQHKEGASEWLINSPDPQKFRSRQQTIEFLKDRCAQDRSVKKSLDLWLWGKAIVTEVWTDRVVATLVQDLMQAMTAGGQWSLQILPNSLNGVGHHVALGQSPNGTHWWLLDTAVGLLVFANAECLARNLLLRLLSSGGINFQSRTVLLSVSAVK